MREEALAAMRKLNRRQSDVEAMVENHYSPGPDLVPLLDLQLTPRLQQLINEECRRTAEYAHTKPGGSDEILERDFMWGQLPNLEWMHTHGGDCRDCVALLKAAALEYQDTKVRRNYLKALEKLSK